jgi:hypothetical protein
MMIVILARAVTCAALFGLVLVFLPAQVLSMSGITPLVAHLNAIARGRAEALA